MRSFFYIVFFVLFAFFVSCSTENPLDDSQNSKISYSSNIAQTTDTQIVTLKNQQQDTLSETQEPFIISLLRSVNDKYLLTIIKSYLNGQNMSSLVNHTVNTAEFIETTNDQDTHIIVQYIRPFIGEDIISISLYNATDLGFENYFYFLQKFNGKWSNVTGLVVSDEIIYNLTKGLNTKIDISEIDSITAYKTQISNYALLFDFIKNPQVKIFDGSNWNTAIYIKFINGTFRVVKNQSVATKNSQLLNDEELEKARIFYDIKSALSIKDYAFVLDISENGISNLPTDIYKLQKLQTLILNDNFLQSLPEAISKLSNLQILRISNNKLSELPENIYQLYNLKELTLSNNKLKYLPTSLSNMTNLEVLNLDNNQLTSFVIDCSQLKKVVILNLSSNQIKKLPASIKNMKNLISLDLSNNPIEYLPTGIYELPNLSYIDVRNTQIPEEQILKLWDNNPDLTIMMN